MIKTFFEHIKNKKQESFFCFFCFGGWVNEIWVVTSYRK